MEYSEITNRSAEARNDDGSLVYSAANICIHYFTTSFLRRVVDEHERKLVHHVAKKKIPHVSGETGEMVKPDRPNGIKMEKFVFDVFRFAGNFVVWECVREEEFAPLKNAAGAADSTPAHCRDAVYALHQKYVLAAGGRVVDADGKKLGQMASPSATSESNNNNNNNEDKTEPVVCEISPLVSYAGEGLEELVTGKELPVPLTL